MPQNLSSEARTVLQQYAEHTADHDPRKDLFAMVEGASPRSGS